VTHVVNWDLPQDVEDYVHRIGCTARAGAGGKAIALVDEASALYLEPIEKFIGQKITVEWPEDDLILPEIRPTADERRRYAEERRARLDARRGRDDRGGRRGGGRERGHRPAERRPGAEPRRDAPPPTPPAAPGGAPSGAPGRRRRRGRRGGSGSPPAGGEAPPA
jgi:superfamily II DNA/RNA helicase